MKPYRSLLIVLVVALAGAFGWHLLADDPGYLLLTFRGWSVETSLVVALLGLLLAGLLLTLLLRALRAPWRLWRRRRQQSARQRLAGGLLALHEGRWIQAERMLRAASSDRSLRVPALLYAAQAARARGDLRQTEALLALASDAGGELDAALPAIERLLDEGRAGTAMEMLEHLAREHAALPPRALELQARALTANGRSEQAVALLPQLRRALPRGADERLHTLETAVLVAHLQQASSADELQRRWASLARAQRTQPALVEAFAERAAGVGNAGAAAEAAEAIEKAVDRQWSTTLARLYGRLAQDRPRALRIAEGWLDAHPDDPGVLLSLGRLCRHEQLWGKAQAYLARAINHGAGADGWEVLAQVHVDQHDDTRARQAYQNALMVSRGETVRPLLRHEKPPIEAVEREERSSMGVPRLPAA